MRLPRFINKLLWPMNALKYRGMNGINSRKEFYKIIEHERERANRNGHQISLVVFNLDAFPNDGNEKKQLIKNIIRQKRNIDKLGLYKKHSVGIILPYTSSNGARQFSVRLSRTLNFIMPDSFCYLFTYPLEDKPNDDGKSKDSKTAESSANDVANASDDAESSTHEENPFDDNVQNTSLRGVSP